MHKSMSPQMMSALAENDCNRVTHILKNREADLEAITDDGYTAMHLSADKGSARLLKCLISQGAKIDPLDRNSRTPLLISVYAKNIKIMSMLIEAGANPHIRDTSGMSAISAAFSTNFEEGVLLFKKMSFLT